MLELYSDLVTLEELCEILHIGKNTAYRLLAEGKLRAFKIGRVWKISKDAVAAYIVQMQSK